MDYTIQIDLKKKTAKVKKVIAFNETAIPVSVINIGSFTAADLRLRLYRDNVICAEIAALAADGVNASGTLDLSEAAIAAVFSGLPARASKNFSLCISDTTDNSLLVNQQINIINNPDV